MIKECTKEPIFKGKEQSFRIKKKDFIGLKDKELKDREVKIKRSIKRRAIF